MLNVKSAAAVTAVLPRTVAGLQQQRDGTAEVWGRRKGRRKKEENEEKEKEEVE